MAEIFDFAIAINARDNASASLDDVFEKLQTMHTQMSNTESEGIIGKDAPAKVGMVSSAINGLTSAIETLSGVHKTLSESFDDDFLTVEDNYTKLAAQSTMSMSEASAATDKYISKTFELSIATGASVTAISEMGAALAQSSIFLDDEDIIKNAEAITHLGTTWEIEGNQLASLIGNTRFLGITIKDTLNEVAAASAAFKVPGLIENLPEVLNNVNNLFAEYGDRVTGDTGKITSSFIKQAAVASKAYNITMADAINKVNESMTKFVSELDQADDVFLGLSDDFGAGTNALFELGFSLQETQDLLKLGRDDALGFATAIKDAAANKDMMTQRRLLKMIGKEFGGQTKELLERESVYNSMIQARDDAQKREAAGLVTFDDMTQSFRNSGKQLIDVFNTAIALGKTIIGGVLGKSAKSIFGGATDSLKDLNEQLLAINKRMNDPDSFFQKNIVPKMESIGKAVLVVSGGIASIASAFGLVTGIKGIGKILELLTGGKSGGISKLGKSIGGLGKKFLFFGKKLLAPIMIFDTIMQAFKATGEGGIIKGLAVAIDKTLMGIPSFLIQKFFPQLGSTWEEGWTNVKNYVSSIFTMENTIALFNGMWNGVKWVGNQIVAYLDDIFSGWGANTQMILLALEHRFYSVWNPIRNFMGETILFFSDGWAGFQKMLINVWDGLRSATSKFTHFVKVGFFKMIENIGAFYGGMISMIGEGLSYINKDLGASIKSAADKVKSATAFDEKKLDEEHQKRLGQIAEANANTLAAIDERQRKKRLQFEKEKENLAVVQNNRMDFLVEETLKFDKEQKRRSRMEKAARAKSRREKEQEEKKTSSSKLEEQLKNNKEWAKAIIRADEAVSAARAKVLSGGGTIWDADVAGYNEGLKQASKLDKLASRITTKSTGGVAVSTPVGPSATPLEESFTGPLKTVGASQQIDTSYLKPNVNTAAMMPDDYTDQGMINTLVNQVNELVKVVKKQEVEVKVSLDRGLLSEYGKKVFTAMRGRLGN